MMFDRFRYIAVLKVLTILEFYGVILGVALLYWLTVPSPWFALIVLMLVLRLMTVHLNTRHIEIWNNVQGPYLIWPFT